MIRSRPLIPLTAVTASLVLAASAGAVPLPGATGGFGITAARRNVTAQPGIDLTPTTVINSTDTGYQVAAFPAILTQDLTGAYDFAETPRNLTDSRMVLSTSPQSFALPARQQLSVRLHWNLLPQNQPWIAIGVVFQGTPQGQTGPVRVITRLLSVNLLRLPGAYRVDGAFTGLYPEQFGAHQLRVVARVKNTGTTFGSPSAGRLTIRDSGGQVVFAEPWTGETLIPGAQVDFPIVVKKVLPAGSYTATVSMRFGGGRALSAGFTLVGPNRLPTPAIAVRGFNATGAVGSPAHVTARILSTGTAPAAVTLHLYLGTASEAPGATALATRQVSYSNLAPGTVKHLSRPLGRDLRKGSYRVVVTWVDPTGAPHTTEATFTTTVGTSLPQAIWAFIKQLVPVLVGVLLLALLVAMAYLVRRLREGQRQISAELAAAREELQAARLDDQAGPQATTRGPTRPRPPRSGVAATPARAKTRATRNGVTTNGASAARAPTTTKHGPGTNGSSAKPTGAKTSASGTRSKPIRTKSNGIQPARATPAKRTSSKSSDAASTANRTAAKPAGRKSNGGGSGAGGASPKATRAKSNGSPSAARSTRAKTTAPKTNGKGGTDNATPAKANSTRSGTKSAVAGSRTKLSGAGPGPAIPARPPSRRPQKRADAGAQPTAPSATNGTAPPGSPTAQPGAAPPSATRHRERADELLALATRRGVVRRTSVDRRES